MNLKLIKLYFLKELGNFKTYKEPLFKHMELVNLILNVKILMINKIYLLFIFALIWNFNQEIALLVFLEIGMWKKDAKIMRTFKFFLLLDNYDFFNLRISKMYFFLKMLNKSFLFPLRSRKNFFDWKKLYKILSQSIWSKLITYKFII